VGETRTGDTFSIMFARRPARCDSHPVLPAERGWWQAPSGTDQSVDGEDVELAQEAGVDTVSVAAAPVPPSGPVGSPQPVTFHGGGSARRIRRRGRRAYAGELRLLATMLGGLAGGAVALSNPERDGGTHWVLFVVLSTLLGVASGESFDFAAARWRELAGSHGLRLRDVTPTVLSVVGVAVGLIAATPHFIGDEGLTWRGVAFAGLAVVGGLPAAATLGAVQRLCRDPLPGPPGAQLELLMVLRRHSTRLLNQLGLLVVLVIGVNGAATGFGQALSPTVVIFSGGVASLVVGTMFVPASAALRRRGALFIEEHFRLVDVPVERLVSAAEQRNALEHLLGIDQTTFGELKNGLVIMTPFVISALAALIPTL
jgi:hypothetical protein